MRRDLEKRLFIGPKDKKQAFFAQAQHLGVIHFTPVEAKKLPELVMEDNLLDIEKALKILERQPTKEQKPLPQGEEREILQEVLQRFSDLDVLYQEKRKITSQKDLVQPLGSFSKESLREIADALGWYVAIFSAKRKYLPESNEFQYVIEVAQQEELVYFVVFSQEPLDNPKWLNINLDRDVSALNHTLQELHYEEKKHHRFLEESACFVEDTRRYLDHQRDKYDLIEAQRRCQGVIEDHFFSVSGWVPENKVQAVKDLAAKHHVLNMECSVPEGENPPTYLENRGLPRVGQDLVEIYDTPSHTDKGPSSWVLVFFMLFFAMIVGDAGYGLIFLGIAGWLWYRYPDVQGVYRRVLKLWTLLSSMTIVWGLLMHSFFATPFDHQHPANRYSLLGWLVQKKADYLVSNNTLAFQEWIQQNHVMIAPATGTAWLKYPVEHGTTVQDALSSSILMEIAIVVGLIHITFSFLRYIFRNPSGLGWTFAMWGGYIYFPELVGATIMPNYLLGLNPEMLRSLGAEWMLWGTIMAFVLALYRDGIKGLLELMNSIQILSDILSCLRLYALGLAGGIMASTINMMAGNLPWFFAIIVLFFAHLINMMLGVMGGVIHGLRLNFLEWYHYSFEGGGKPYQPLKLREPS